MVNDFKETLSISQHNGVLGQMFGRYDYCISQEDLADGSTKCIKWDIALDVEHISKVIMDFAETLEQGRKDVAAFCKHNFDKQRTFILIDEY